MNPWVILAIVIAWVASLAAVGSWQNDAGVTSERAKNLAKENAQLVAANKEIERLRKIEQVGASQIITIGDDHARNIAALEAQHLRDLDAVRTGALKLRVAGACHPAVGPGEVPAAAAGSNAATTGELPPEITRDLLKLADDADANTIDLGTCQAAVNSYLATQEAAAK